MGLLRLHSNLFFTNAESEWDGRVGCTVLPVLESRHTWAIDAALARRARRPDSETMIVAGAVTNRQTPGQVPRRAIPFVSTVIAITVGTRG